jgi:hypothetical protein
MKKLISTFIGLIAITALVLAFQNCSSGLAPLSQVIQNQSLAENDGQKLPTLLASENLVYWQVGEQTTKNKAPIFTDVSSAVVAFDRTTKGLIYRFNAGENSDEARISVEADGKTIRLWHITSGTSYSYTDAIMPANGDRILVAAFFGMEPKDFVFLVNGLNQTINVQKVGTPLNFSYLQKTVLLQGTAGVTHEAVTFAQTLSGYDLNVMARYIATTSQVPNVVYDPSLTDTGGGGGGNVVPTAQFTAAKAIIDANCLACHNGSNYGDFRNLTQDQFIQRGLVAAKNPAASKIYYRLVGASAGPGPMTMPQGSALPAAQVQTIADWINSIQ